MRKRRPSPELLNKACAELCRRNLCEMECDVYSAKIGWCRKAWRMAKGEEPMGTQLREIKSMECPICRAKAVTLKRVGNKFVCEACMERLKNAEA